MGKKSNYSLHLTWIVPLLLSMLIAGYNMYSLIERVDIVEDIQNTRSAEYIKKIDEIDYRVKRIEEFCCSEIDHHKKED